MIILEKQTETGWEEFKKLDDAVIKNGVLNIPKEDLKIDSKDNFRAVLKNKRTACILKCQINYV